MKNQNRLRNRDTIRVSGQGRIRERMSNLQDIIGNLDIQKYQRYKSGSH